MEVQRNKQDSSSTPIPAKANSSGINSLEKESEDHKVTVGDGNATKADSSVSLIDPLRLFETNREDESDVTRETETVWKQSASRGEYAFWRLLPSELRSQIRREDGFVTTVEDVEYTYRNLNGGMIYRSSESDLDDQQKQSAFENEVQNEQLSRRKRNTVSLIRNDGTSAEILVRYGTNREAWVRQLTRERLEEAEQSNIVEKLFNLSKENKNIEFKPIRIKQERTEVAENVLLLQIYIRVGRKFTRTISGGNYDFVGGSDTGYLITASSEADDDYLLKTAISVIRKLSFACYPSNISAYCFLSNNMPTIAGQRELLTTICNKIMSEVMQYNA